MAETSCRQRGPAKTKDKSETMQEERYRRWKEGGFCSGKKCNRLTGGAKEGGNGRLEMECGKPTVEGNEADGDRVDEL